MPAVMSCHVLSLFCQAWLIVPFTLVCILLSPILLQFCSKCHKKGSNERYVSTYLAAEIIRRIEVMIQANFPISLSFSTKSQRNQMPVEKLKSPCM